MSETIRPFANGTEFRAWKEANCAVCPVGWDNDKMIWRCSIESGLDLAGITDGMISQGLADRMGLNDQTMFEIGWPCKERELRR